MAQALTVGTERDWNSGAPSRRWCTPHRIAPPPRKGRYGGTEEHRDRTNANAPAQLYSKQPRLRPRPRAPHGGTPDRYEQQDDSTRCSWDKGGRVSVHASHKRGSGCDGHARARHTASSDQRRRLSHQQGRHHGVRPSDAKRHDSYSQGANSCKSVARGVRRSGPDAR
jgi:hypothetical protein